MEEGLLSDAQGAPAAGPAPPTATSGPVVVALRQDGALEARARDVTLTVGRASEGLRSVELLLAGLGSCMVGTLVDFARRNDIALAGARLELVPVLGGRPERVVEVRLRLRLDGDLAPRRLATLRRAAERCKVHATLEHPPVLSLELEHGGS